MTELFVETNNENKKIGIVEDKKIIEYYEEDSEVKRREGNIYIGIVKNIIKGMQVAFVDIGTEKNALIHLKDLLPKIDETKENYDNTVNISDIVKIGQKLLVQVKKDSNKQKGARVSTHINLVSKYIVLLPNTNIITISKKIENEEEQERLKKLIKANISEGYGAIIRTSAEGKDDEIVKDIAKTEYKWKNIIETNINLNLDEPKLLYNSENIIDKMLIDLPNNKISKIIVNNESDYKYFERIKKENIEYKNLSIEIKEDIFNIYELNKQIEKIRNRKIWLKCGGFITIDKTEALTAIDVNTGKYTGTKGLEETIFKVNKEATIEIARQLRLRDIGGIIIIDYIDMDKNRNKEEIEKLLKTELKKDRSKTQVEGFTKLDLMELTRKHICSHK